MRGASHLVTW